MIKKQVEEFIDEGDDTPEEQLIKKRKKERIASAKPSLLGSIFNPIKLALHPVQLAVAPWVPTIRGLFNLIMWKDRILTFCFFISIFLTTILLACVPWGFIIYWTSRLVRHMPFQSLWHCALLLLA